MEAAQHVIGAFTIVGSGNAGVGVHVAKGDSLNFRHHMHVR